MLILYNLEWSDYYLCLLIFLTKLSRSTTFATTEKAIEITQIVEATTPTDFTDTVDGVDQPASSLTQADVYDIFREILACAQLEKAAES
jgi:hypothetical protein